MKKIIKQDLYLKRELTTHNKKYDTYYQRYFKNINGKILDVSCATGNFVNLDKENIIGIDFNKKYLEVARKRGLNVIEANVDKKIPFKDNCFDIVHCRDSFQYYKNPDFVLKEFKRILKRNGRLFILQGDSDKSKYTLTEKKERTMIEYGRKDVPFIPYNKKKMYELLNKAGFKNIKIRDHNLYFGTHFLARKRILPIKLVMLIEDIIYLFIKSKYFMITGET